MSVEAHILSGDPTSCLRGRSRLDRRVKRAFLQAPRHSPAEPRGAQQTHAGRARCLLTHAPSLFARVRGAPQPAPPALRSAGPAPPLTQPARSLPAVPGLALLPCARVLAQLILAPPLGPAHAGPRPCPRVPPTPNPGSLLEPGFRLRPVLRWRLWPRDWCVVGV